MRFALLVLSACASVSQDRATGPDGVIEGAREVPMDRGRAEATGTVSYPYGDRVDWIAITLPKPGAVEFDFEWFPKSERDRVVFEIWNSNWVRISRHRGWRGERTRVEIEHGDLRGRRIYVRVYVPRVSDAGSYSMIARHYTTPPIDWLAETIPGPPALPAIPEAPPAAPRPPPVPRPPKFRVIQLQVTSTDLLVRFNAGWDDGVTMQHRVRFVTLDGQPLAGGEIVLERVDKRVTTGRTKLTAQDVSANPYVKVDPP